MTRQIGLLDLGVHIHGEYLLCKLKDTNQSLDTNSLVLCKCDRTLFRLYFTEKCKIIIPMSSLENM